MKDLEEMCFQMISFSGSARSGYIEAMRYARKSEFEKAKELIDQSHKDYLKAHNAHSELLTEHMNDENFQISLILMHAEDQLMAAETFKLICEENIELIKLIKESHSEDK